MPSYVVIGPIPRDLRDKLLGLAISGFGLGSSRVNSRGSKNLSNRKF